MAPHIPDHLSWEEAGCIQPLAVSLAFAYCSCIEDPERLIWMMDRLVYRLENELTFVPTRPSPSCKLFHPETSQYVLTMYPA